MRLLTLAKTILLAVAISAGGPPILAQETDELAEPPASTETDEKSALDLLDDAMSKKMTARRMRDLDEVISLCEKSLAVGLDEDNEAFAKDLLSSTHYEMAKRVVQSLGGGRVNLTTYTHRRTTALKSLEKALEVNPNNAECHLLIAQIQRLPGGDAELGRESINKAIELLADEPVRRSVALVARAALSKDMEERIKDYDEAIEVDVQNLDAWRERGRAHLLNDQLDEAVRDFLHLVEKDKDDRNSLKIAAEILVTQDKQDQALALINDLVETNPEDGNAYLLRAGVLMQQEKTDAARADLDKALEIDAGDIEALLARSELSAAEEDYEEARADVDRALELRPGLPQGFILRSAIAMNTEDYRQAVADLRQLLRRDPGNKGLLLQVAAVYLADERPSMAVDVYDEILAEDPEAWAAVSGRADALLGLGRHKEAVKYYEKVLQANPDDSNVLNNLAWVLATSTFDDLRDGKRALELAEKACELTEFKAAHIVSTLAAGHAELGDFDKAREWSSKAVELGTGPTKEQLQAELEKYKADQPWRERQQVEKLDDDLSGVAEESSEAESSEAESTDSTE